MKVLMFGWEFPPHITGGLGTACYGLTNAMVNLGMEVLFVVPKVYGDEDQNFLRLVNCEDITLDLRNQIYESYRNHLSYLEVNSSLVPYQTEEEYFALIDDMRKEGRMKDHLYSENFRFSGGYGANLYQEVDRYALIAATIAKENTFDIIHAHDWLTYKAGIEAKRVSGKPLVIHVHATEFDRSGENVNSHVYGIEKYGMDNADLIVCVSNWTRDIVINRYHQPAGKVVTVHNGVESCEEKQASLPKTLNEKVVTFLGRVTYQKGPEYFIEAAYKVLQKDKNVRFVLAGSGDMLNKMILRVAKLGIADRFHFTGFLKGKEVDQMFSLSDVYVMPSVSEPFGISPLEAMRSNVPVIISKQSGVSEVLKNALKVDFWDIDAMADAIYALLHYPALAKMFAIEGKSEVETIRWDNAAKLLKEFYELEIEKNS